MFGDVFEGVLGMLLRLFWVMSLGMTSGMSFWGGWKSAGHLLGVSAGVVFSVVLGDVFGDVWGCVCGCLRKLSMRMSSVSTGSSFEDHCAHLAGMSLGVPQAHS